MEMDEFVYVGKIVGTHGIKGEIRILSDCEVKKQIFTPNFNIYIGPNKQMHTIKSYRHHKNFEMICIDDYTNINDVLYLKNALVYAKRSDLKIDNYLMNDLINLNVIFKEENIGKVQDILKNSGNNLLEIQGEKHFYIPVCDEYIKKVDLKNKQIIVQDIEGLML